MVSEEQWAFYSRLAYRVHYAQKPSWMMLELYHLVQEKDYFVVTSNGEDHFTPAGFLPERVFEMEGKLTEYRCASHCHDTVYNNREDVLHMAAAEPNCTYITFNKGELYIPTELSDKSIGVDGDIADEISKITAVI